MPTIAQLVKTWPQKLSNKDQEPCIEVMPPEKGSLHQGLYDYAEKTELGFEEGCKGETYKCDGSHCIYPWRRT